MCLGNDSLIIVINSTILSNGCKPVSESSYNTHRKKLDV
jgi:hypothetical protein